ncbi:MAG: M20/M25/M40 family metallo-hydrolase, partial [Syntrophomonadaceae bacterium]|nr:M20/M25/M40 family metallo-hydrolase [Syntrophomonadaceae bacterium]
KLVETGSESGKEGKFKDLLIDLFNQRGIKAVEDNSSSVVGGDSGNLLISIPGTIETTPLLFSAHMDTVSPGMGIKAVIDNGIIRSQGDTILGADDKAAIAALIEALDVLKENSLQYPPLEFLFTVGEEQGLNGAKAFDYSKLKARSGYVLDGGGDPGTIILRSPCQNEIEFKVYGKAAHAGINPEDGINAIKLAAQAIAQMPCGRIDEETTCNIGLIEGGKARNIVADYCVVKGEARSLKRAKLDNLTDELVNTFKTTVESLGGEAEVDVTFLYPEISLDKDDEVIRTAVKAVEKIGLEPVLTSTGGGSDASIINGNGIACANLGIGMQKVHTNEEFIKIEDLVNDTKLVLAIIEEYLASNS